MKLAHCRNLGQRLAPLLALYKAHKGSVTHLSVVSLAAVVFCQEPSQPSKAESNQIAQPQNAQDHSPGVKLSIKDTKKLVVKRVRPVYPDIARNAGLTGRWGVSVVITPQGEIGEVRLLYGHPLIAPAALDARLPRLRAAG